jgi:hypothetical protein
VPTASQNLMASSRLFSSKATTCRGLSEGSASGCADASEPASAVFPEAMQMEMLTPDLAGSDSSFPGCNSRPHRLQKRSASPCGNAQRGHADMTTTTMGWGWCGQRDGSECAAASEGSLLKGALKHKSRPRGTAFLTWD